MKSDFVKPEAVKPPNPLAGAPCSAMIGVFATMPDGERRHERYPSRSGAGLDELEAALQVLIYHAERDGGYSPYYDQWQDILHGLGRLIALKRRDSSNKR